MRRALALSLRAGPGVLLAAAIAVASQALAAHYGAPAMLFALLLGMAFHHLARAPRAEPGIAFTAQTLLRLGVALLGLRLSLADIAQLGAAPIVAVVVLVFATLGIGAVLARLLGRSPAFGILAGGAVAICGASAAAAIAATLPPRRVAARDLLFVVAGVTTLSTLAMILYPILFAGLDHAPHQAGFLIGATIHDVAQVVGAGYSMGDETGDIATFVKLLRVALLPVVLALIVMRERGAGGMGAITLPWFLAAFVVLAIMANAGLVPAAILAVASAASAWLLLAAIAALGVQTSLAEIGEVGIRAAAVIGGATLFLLGAALVTERIVF